MMDLKKYIADIPDFPSKGILFRDVTPLLKDKEAYKCAVEELSRFGKEVNAELVLGPESRGFIFGCPVAVELGVGFVPVRKPNKLPRETVSVKYDLEYGSNELYMHKDSIIPGQKVLIIDDLLATGGTVNATIEMVEQLGGVVVGCAFLIELEALKGREALKNVPVFTVLKY